MFKEDRDYLNFKKKANLVNNEKVILSTTIWKFNDAGRIQDWILIITEHAVYNFQGNSIKRRIPIDKVEAISISKISSEFVIHVKDEYDYRYTSYERRNEIIETILAVLCNIRKLCMSFVIYEIDKLNLNSLMTTFKHF